MTHPGYTYIGKDGQPVLARDLEDERDTLRAQLTTARNDALEECMDIARLAYTGDSDGRDIADEIQALITKETE